MKDLKFKVVLRGLEEVEGVKEDIERGLDKMGLCADVSEEEAGYEERRREIDQVIELVDYYWSECISLEEVMDQLKPLLKEIKVKRDIFFEGK